MKKRILDVLLFIAIFLSSCRSIYGDQPSITLDSESSNIISIGEDDEYYTSGTLDKSGNIQHGYLYYDYWIYTELHYYKELADVSPTGGKVYNNKVAQRIVKLNTATGAVSSLCLSPSCNHSPRSGCDMIAEDAVASNIRVASVVGDWLVITKSKPDEVYGARYENFAYNPMTGERKDMFVNEYGETSVTDWIGKAPFENKLYSIRIYMDYSNTGYVPGGDKPMYEFEPETVNFCCYYDFDTQKTVELFEVPEGYRTASVTNKRIYFKTPEGNIVSYAHDGKDMVKEDVIDFSPYNKIGTYAYNADSGLFEMYDLKTNTKKQINVPFTSYQYPTFTRSGIIYDTWTTIDEWDHAIDGYKAFETAHPDLRGMELQNAFIAECNKVKYSGTAQVWRSNFEGEELEVIFEKENAVIQTICGSDKFLFAYVIFGDPDNGYNEITYENEGRSMINLETGEITPVPMLEFIPPSDELMIEIINKNHKDN